jgi:DNA-binding PadR family transcriptional regulator
MHRHFHFQRDRACHGRGFGRGGHGRMGGGRGRWLGRMLDHGDLRYVVLALLAEQPRHGYELMRALEERTGGAYRPSPGVIYPTLSLLEDEGLAQSKEAEGGRKLFEATAAGREALEKNRAAVDAMFQRMDEAGASSALSSPKVLRAMENLKTAVKLRLAQGSMTEAQIEAVAAALDGAATQVERV